MKPSFPAGIPVQGEDLVGREKELQLILNMLRDAQSVVLVSPRRYGKTSLVLEVLDRLKKEGYFVGDIDIFRVLSREELAQKITETTVENRKIKKIVKHLRESLAAAFRQVEIKSVIEEYEFILSLVEKKLDEDTLLDMALDFPEEFAGKNGKKMIFAYDEFGDLVKLDGEALIKKMRAAFQRHRNVTYLFTGSQESVMEKLFSSVSSAFFRFGRIIKLSEVPKDAFKGYILNKLKTLKVEISESAVDGLLAKTEGHPYYTQLVCQMLYYSAIEKGRTIGDKDVDSAYKQAVITEIPYCVEMWGRIANRNHLQVLRHIAIEESSPYKIFENKRQDVYYILSCLEEKGYIRRVEKGQYKLTDPFFKEYIKMKESDELEG